MATAISFNGNSLQTSSIVTQDIDDGGMPTIVAPVYRMAHANRRRVPNTDYPEKVITITGELVGNSIADCDSALDTLKGYLAASEANLDIDYNGTTRRYTATLTGSELPRPGRLQRASFTLEFSCMPFGQNTSATTALTATGRASSSYNDDHTFLGNAPEQLLVYTVTYSVLTATGDTTVTIGNANTGQQITITRTWSSSDVLVVDCLNQSVKVNGVEVEFSGAFPFFPKGAQTMTYADTHTTRTFNVSATYYPLWF